MNSPPATDSTPIEFKFPREPFVECLVKRPNNNNDASPMLPPGEVESI